jgi:hypothetical protein
MLSGTPTQNATSVADLPTLLGLDDTPYKNGEMAFVVSLQRYFALNYGAPAGAGVPAKSGHGQWIIYSAAQAVIPGVGAPTIPVTIGALYLDTATGALYAGDSAPAWVAVGGGAPPTRPSVPRFSRPWE